MTREEIQQRPAAVALMKINTNALLGAAAWGIAIQLMAEILRTFIAYTIATGGAQAETFPLIAIGDWTSIRADILLSLVVLVVTDIGIGFLYAILHIRETTIVANDGAGGGSAAATIAHSVTGIFGIGLTWLVGRLLLAQSLEAAYAFGTVIPSIWRWLLIIGMGSVLGAIGGVAGTTLVLGWRHWRQAFTKV